MEQRSIDRRRFHRWGIAAIGGLLAGSVPLAAQQESGDKSKPGGKEKKRPLELHACRGLNTCKGKGADGKNDCAGRGVCATVEPHDCAARNKCRGLGGCGENPGFNRCKGRGEGEVPLDGETWDLARKLFEEYMKRRNVKLGPAPPADYQVGTEEDTQKALQQIEQQIKSLEEERKKKQKEQNAKDAKTNKR